MLSEHGLDGTIQTAAEALGVENPTGDLGLPFGSDLPLEDVDVELLDQSLIGHD